MTMLSPRSAPVLDRGPAPPTPTPAPAPEAPPVPRRSRLVWRLLVRLGAVGSAIGLGLLGIGAFVALWAVVSWRVPDLPTPRAAWDALTQLLADPFHDGGPTDKGIALQLGASLGRVLRGFTLAALVGVPFGLLVGGSRRAWQAANPVIQLLRPVSPLAWFPIGLVVLKDAPQAAVFVIFVTALWPVVINTAAGAASIPGDQRNVARVFRFGRLAYVRHVMVPHTLPSIITGLRLSMGIAWMVIVAVEMLSGGSGIGFFVWDSYNAGDLADVIAAILLIGGVGVALDSAFVWIGRRVTFEEGSR
jgi:nitrate/nitrite transport system permease protein